MRCGRALVKSRPLRMHSLALSAPFKSSRCEPNSKMHFRSECEMFLQKTFLKLAGSKFDSLNASYLARTIRFEFKS